jgi:hypothetical protein
LILFSFLGFRCHDTFQLTIFTTLHFTLSFSPLAIFSRRFLRGAAGASAARLRDAAAAPSDTVFLPPFCRCRYFRCHYAIFLPDYFALIDIFTPLLSFRRHFRFAALASSFLRLSPPSACRHCCEAAARGRRSRHGGKRAQAQRCAMRAARACAS